ncbi:type VI secretion system tip protein VgrG [Burkholderia sp. Bp8992]|uniref:type VI secretion system Vgr family protein n=1 Tax=Burkholderia sp. Bp8992 TaxID=2184554 RepID=UPI000F58E381|nr:type VI secretion system Vgr family protein [Burkholderia sp. Bp8992]RQS19236.1 type VI secretion system tip protein VgrG [Burkholderia sp. Bp8992]
MNSQELVRAIGGGLFQQARLLKLDTPLGQNVLLPQTVHGVSRLGRDYTFTVDAVSTRDNIELKKLIAQPVTLWIEQQGDAYLPWHGYVQTARRLGFDGGVTSYQIRFMPWLGFLRYRRDQRIWQDRTADEILTDVFNQHPQAAGMFRFALSAPLRNRSFCMQFEDDWHFVHRLLEDEGLFGYFEQAGDGSHHTLVITDSLRSLPAAAPARVPFQRTASGDETQALVQWSGSRTLQSSHYTTRTFDYKSPGTALNPKGTDVPTRPDQGDLPNQAEVYMYTGAYTYGAQGDGNRQSTIRMEEWESRAKRFHGIGGMRGIDAGRVFELTDHAAHPPAEQDGNRFAVVETVWWIRNNLPAMPSHFPHGLAARFDAMKAQLGDAAGAMTMRHADGSEGFYLVEIEAQRQTVPFRSPFEHPKPEMHLQTATVAGPKGEEVHTDELNRIKVRFHWDRQNEGDERASCWLRVASSDTGGGYGSVHVPRIGEEVVVDWMSGDCDRPIVTARLYNGATKPQWHTDGLLSGFRSKEYAGGGYNQLVMDDATGQNRAQLYSSTANSLLHIGYLIEQSGNTRGTYVGSGFDLRTDACGAVRANQGLYVTTHPNGVSSQPLDVRETQQQLVGAEGLLESLSDVSETHQADTLSPGRDALKTFTDATQQSMPGAASGGRTSGGGTGNANAFAQPVMLFGSPAGIGLASQQSVQMVADRHVNIVSGQTTHLVTGKSLIASAIASVSLFAQNAGMKLFAGKGKIEVRAHDDDVQITAQKTVKIVAATAQIDVASKQPILLTSGGAYIRIGNGNIEIHAPGKVDFKGGDHSFSGPTSTDYPLPRLPEGVCSECRRSAAKMKSALTPRT